MSRRDELRAKRAQAMARTEGPRRAAPKARSSAVAELSPSAGRSSWTPPTRRTFFGLLLATGAVAVVARKVAAPEEPERSTWTGKTRWIGHC